MRNALLLCACLLIFCAAGCGSGEVTGEDVKKWEKAEGQPEQDHGRDR